ncbi:MAK10-like protein [Tanacetum coccineum]
MPYSTYMKLTDEKPAETDIRLSLASHSYIYPLGIAEDVLVEIADHVYPADFVIMDIKENEKRPFILGMPFLTTAKASIKFDTGIITLRSGKSKISFNRIHNGRKDKDFIKKGRWSLINGEVRILKVSVILLLEKKMELRTKEKSRRKRVIFDEKKLGDS